MHQVQAAEFMATWGHKLSSEQKQACSESSFFLCKAGGFALKFKRKMCMVVMNVGDSGGNHMRELVKWLREQKIRSIVFYYRENSPVSAFVKYVKARHWVSQDFYETGEPAHLAMVRLNTKRLRHG